MAAVLGTDQLSVDGAGEIGPHDLLPQCFDLPVLSAPLFLNPASVRSVRNRQSSGESGSRSRGLPTCSGYALANFHAYDPPRECAGTAAFSSWGSRSRSWCSSMAILSGARQSGSTAGGAKAAPDHNGDPAATADLTGEAGGRYLNHFCSHSPFIRKASGPHR